MGTATPASLQLRDRDNASCGCRGPEDLLVGATATNRRRRVLRLHHPTFSLEAVDLLRPGRSLGSRQSLEPLKKYRRRSGPILADRGRSGAEFQSRVSPLQVAVDPNDQVAAVGSIASCGPVTPAPRRPMVVRDEIRTGRRKPGRRGASWRSVRPRLVQRCPPAADPTKGRRRAEADSRDRWVRRTPAPYACVRTPRLGSAIYQADTDPHHPLSGGPPPTADRAAVYVVHDLPLVDPVRPEMPTTSARTTALPSTGPSAAIPGDGAHYKSTGYDPNLKGSVFP